MVLEIFSFRIASEGSSSYLPVDSCDYSVVNPSLLYIEYIEKEGSGGKNAQPRIGVWGSKIHKAGCIICLYIINCGTSVSDPRHTLSLCEEIPRKSFHKPSHFTHL